MQDSCFIVGSGPSLSPEFNYKIFDDKDSIVINQSIFRVPNAKYFITIDGTWLHKSHVSSQRHINRTKFQNHPAEKIFVVTFSGDRLHIIDDHHVEDRQHRLVYDLTLFDKIVFTYAYGGIGRNFDEFHCGSESGYAALQLAVILGYKNIYLFGLDFCTRGKETHSHHDYVPRDHKTYNKKLEEFLTPYEQALKYITKELKINVYSCSHISRLNDYIQYVDFRNF